MNPEAAARAFEARSGARIRVEPGRTSAPAPWRGALGLAAVLAATLLEGCGWVGVALWLGIDEATSDGGPSAPALPAEVTSPRLESVQPRRVASSAPFTVVLHGQRLSGVTEVWLEAEDGTRVATGDVQVATASWLRAHFPLEPDETGGARCHLGPAALCVRAAGEDDCLAPGLFLSAPEVALAGAYTRAGRDAEHLAFLDHDGDGDLDLAVAALQGVVILEGDGKGAFTRGLEVPMGEAGALWLAAVEERPEAAGGDRLVVATATDVRLLVFAGAGDSLQVATRVLWVPEEILEAPRLELADLEGDGARDDIVLITADESLPRVLWNLERGGELAADFFDPGEAPDLASLTFPSDLAVADFDQDGTDDVATVSRLTRRLNFYLGRGPGAPPRWTPRAPEVPGEEPSAPTVGAEPKAVAAANLHDPQYWDEFPDVAVAKGSDEVSLVYVRGRDGEGRLVLTKGSRAASVGSDPVDLVLADVGGPERCRCPEGEPCHSPPDILAANRGSGNVSVNITPLLDFGDPSNLPVAGRPKALALGDLDGDGLADLAVLGKRLGGEEDVVTVLLHAPRGAALDPGGVPFHFASGSGLGETPELPPGLVGLTRVPAGDEGPDLDGDGWPDFAVASRDSNEVVTILSGGGAYGQVDFYPAGGRGTRWVRAGDMDRDGDTDLVASHRISLEVSILYNEGGGFAGPGVAADVLALGAILDPCLRARPRVLDLGDLDGDGDLDIVVPLTAARRALFLWNTLEEPRACRPAAPGPVLPEGGRLQFRAELSEELDSDPRWASTADLDGDGRLEVLFGVENRKDPVTGATIPGSAEVFWNRCGEDGRQVFLRESLPAWGPSCPEHAEPGGVEGDEVEYVLGAWLEPCAPGAVPCPLDILAANTDTISYYRARDDGRFDAARWIPIRPITHPDACPAATCIDQRHDPEFVLPVDLDGDSLADLISIDEEVGRVFVLRQRQALETGSTCVSERFELAGEIEAGSPQAVQAFTREGEIYLATIHRAWRELTLERWEPEAGGAGQFVPFRDVPLGRPERLPARHSLARHEGILCLTQEDVRAVQIVELAGLAGDLHAAAQALPWTLELDPVEVPVALAAGDLGGAPASWTSPWGWNRIPARGARGLVFTSSRHCGSKRRAGRGAHRAARGRSAGGAAGWRSWRGMRALREGGGRAMAGPTSWLRPTRASGCFSRGGAAWRIRWSSPFRSGPPRWLTSRAATWTETARSTWS